ncbi:MAG: DsrE/DsrF/DrsH-like family protein [Myxococcota bacterium]|nr:DsrE/DsrF/DrsH-like family protein [Myxococcota bacterium]
MSQVLALAQQQVDGKAAEEQVREWVRSELAQHNLGGRVDQLESELKRLAPRTVSNRATLVVFSGDMDKVLAGLVIATGAAAMGLEVSMFHTFWGLNSLRSKPTSQGKDLIERAMGAMMPAGLDAMNPSQMSFGGIGAKLFRHRMEKNGVQSPQEFFELAREMGVKFIACQMSMEVMGIRKEELVDGVEVGGVAAYLGDAADSKVTLFI